MSQSVFRIRIRTDPHKEMPPGSGSAWTDADPEPDPGGKKAQKMYRFIRWIQNWKKKSKDPFAVLWIQLGIFWVPDPDPGKSSGSNPYYLSILENCKHSHLKFNHKEESINYLPFTISFYSPTVRTVQNSQRNNTSLSYFAWYMRIRIHKTAAFCNT